jgi:hypothetical protein
LFDIFLTRIFLYSEYWLWICVYNLHQHVKNDTDSTDVVENDYRHNSIDTCQHVKWGYSFLKAALEHMWVEWQLWMKFLSPILPMIYYEVAFKTPMYCTLICIEFRYDMADNLQRLLWLVFFLIALYDCLVLVKSVSCWFWFPEEIYLLDRKFPVNRLQIKKFETISWFSFSTIRNKFYVCSKSSLIK